MRVENKGEICYFCGQPATSKEHVPPKCLFPKANNSIDGKNYRNNLITVPSCDLHNSVKSKDDVYLLYLLAINIISNQHGSQQAKTAVWKDVLRSPSIIKRMVAEKIPVIVQDVESETIFKTMAFKIEEDRIQNIFEHISKALFFHHFGKIFKGNIQIKPEFDISLSLNQNEKNDCLIINDERAILSETMDEALINEPFKGDTPEIFKYKCIWNEESDAIMRLYFYEENKVTLIFEKQSQ